MTTAIHASVDLDALLRREPQALVVAFFPFVPVTIDAIITIYLIGICSAALHATAVGKCLLAFAPIAVPRPHEPAPLWPLPFRVTAEVCS